MIYLPCQATKVKSFFFDSRDLTYLEGIQKLENLESLALNTPNVKSYAPIIDLPLKEIFYERWGNRISSADMQ